MKEKKTDLLQEIWEQQDTAYDLMNEYDGIPHCYGKEIMYHTEGQFIDLVAQYPGITSSDIALMTKKTASACSQLLRKLKGRGFIEQVRNEKNNRKYNLILTESGKKIYEERKVFNRKCQDIMKKKLDEFSEEELQHHIMVQKTINEAYRGDIKRSKMLSTDLH